MFQKLVSFTKKVADLADKPALNASQLKAQFDAAPDEVRQYLNNLIDALVRTTTGDSGAKNIGATVISGLEGTDVQTQMENMKKAIDKVTTLSNWIGMPGYNGWTNYGAPFNVLQCAKDGIGFVHVRGVVKLGTQGSKITELPVGFRPGKGYRFSVPTSGKQVNIDVSANGSVSLDATTTYSDFIFLDLPPFLAEQ
jgi:hypothetical protein